MTRSVSPKTWSEGIDKGPCRMDSWRPRPRGQKPDTKMINLGKGKRGSSAWPRAHTRAASAAPWLKPRSPSKGPCLFSACATVARASSRPLHTVGSSSAEKTSASGSENHHPRGCSSGGQDPDSGPAPAESTTGCGPLRHTSSARPRRAFLSAPVFSRKPRSLCRKPAKHSTRRGCRAAIVQGCAPEGPEAAFPRAEVESRGGGAKCRHHPEGGPRAS